MQFQLVAIAFSAFVFGFGFGMVFGLYQVRRSEQGDPETSPSIPLRRPFTTKKKLAPKVNDDSKAFMREIGR